MLVTAQEYGQSQKGAPKVKANGVWYFLGRDLANPPLNQSVEVRTGSFTAGDKTFPTIEAWRPVPAIQQGAGAHANPQKPANAPVNGGYVDEASMRFISNVVGSAISAKTINEPGQILSWYQAAKAALDGKPAPQPFDDRIPIGKSREPGSDDEGYEQIAPTANAGGW
jgi:hypothetical protein